MASSLAQLVAIYQAGDSEIEGGLNPQRTHLGGYIAKGGAHSVHAHIGTGSKGTGEQPRNALPYAWDGALGPRDAHHEEQWQRDEHHKQHYILTIAHKARNSHTKEHACQQIWNHEAEQIHALNHSHKREYSRNNQREISTHNGIDHNVAQRLSEHYAIDATIGWMDGHKVAIMTLLTNSTCCSFETTGNPYDVAIAGNGYLEVQTPQGVRYTRDGAMIRSATGQLQNMRGQAILGTNGQPIMIPANATDVVINENGQILARVPGQDAHQQLGQLALVDFADRRALLKQGDNLYYPQQGAQPQPATGTIEQGVLERSNSNVVEEMVQLINNYRIYEAGSKAVTTQDGMLDKSVNDVGRLG